MSSYTNSGSVYMYAFYDRYLYMYCTCIYLCAYHYPCAYMCTCMSAGSSAACKAKGWEGGGRGGGGGVAHTRGDFLPTWHKHLKMNMGKHSVNHQ